MGNLPVGLDAPPRAVREARRGAGAQPPSGRAARGRLGRDEQKPETLLGAAADPVEERPSDDRLVGDHEHVLRALLGHVHDDVAHGHPLRDLLHPLDHAAAKPAGTLLRMRRHDDLGRARLELRDRVADGLRRVRLDDEAVRGDAGLAQAAQVRPSRRARRRAARVLVDDIALAGVVDRAMTVTRSTPSAARAFR